jgi:chromosome segregation ATPase
MSTLEDELRQLKQRDAEQVQKIASLELENSQLHGDNLNLKKEVRKTQGRYRALGRQLTINKKTLDNATQLYNQFTDKEKRNKNGDAGADALVEKAKNIMGDVRNKSRQSAKKLRALKAAEIREENKLNDEMGGMALD